MSVSRGSSRASESCTHICIYPHHIHFEVTQRYTLLYAHVYLCIPYTQYTENTLIHSCSKKFHICTHYMYVCMDCICETLWVFSSSKNPTCERKCFTYASNMDKCIVDSHIQCICEIFPFTEKSALLYNKNAIL